MQVTATHKKTEKGGGRRGEFYYRCRREAGGRRRNAVREMYLTEE